MSFLEKVIESQVRFVNSKVFEMTYIPYFSYCKDIFIIEIKIYIEKIPI